MTSPQNMHLSRRAFVGGAVAFGAASMVVPSWAFADPTSAEVQAEADAMYAKLTAMRDQIEQDTKDYYTALDAHDAAVEAMDACQARIDENNAQIAQLQTYLGGRMTTMYRSGQTSFLDILLGSESFEDFARNWDMLQKLNQEDAARVAITKELRADNEAQHAEYVVQEGIAQEQLDEAERLMNESKALAEEYEAEYERLSAEAQELYEKEQEAIRAAEAARKAEELARQQAQSSGGGGGGGWDDDDDDDDGGSWGGYIPPSGSVVDYAYSQIGVPYSQSNPQQAGDHFDCSGLCQWCWLQATGINIGRTTWAQRASANWVGSLSSAEPGDVLYTDGHVGICISSGGGSYIHAPTWGQTVCVSSWSQFYCALRW